MRVLSNSWKQHFGLLPGDNAGNKNMKAFTDAMASSNNQSQKIKDIAADPNAMILGSDGEGSIRIFHSPKNFGGMFTRPTNKIGVLVGLGRKALPVILNASSATQDCDFASPKFADIENCTSSEELEALTFPRNGTRKNFEGSSAFIVAPWLRSVILEADSKDPFVLIPLAISRAKSFDTEHENDSSYETKAIDHAKLFSFWSFGVKKLKVEETRFDIDLDDNELTSYADSMHDQFILPPAARNKEPAIGSNINDPSVILQLNANLARQNELNEENFSFEEEQIQETRRKRSS